MIEGNDPGGPAPERVREHHEADISREAVGDGLPGVSAARAPVDTVVILREQAIGVDVGRHFVHALTGLG